MSLKTSLQRTEAERDEATERVEQSEEAVRSCEGLVAVAEASMIEMRKELGGDGVNVADGKLTPEIEELRATNKVLQEELRIATKEAAEVKTLRRNPSLRRRVRSGPWPPRRGGACASRRLLCRRDCPNSSISKTIGASVIERVTGDVKLPSDLVQRVITLESRLTRKPATKER